MCSRPLTTVAPGAASAPACSAEQSSVRLSSMSIVNDCSVAPPLALALRPSGSIVFKSSTAPDMMK
jgi:hypothetical protein